MSATRLILYLSRSRPSRILKISTPFTADTQRYIHNTPNARAKKSKTKQTQNEDLFDDDEEDLFGSPSTNTQQIKVDASVTKVSPRAAKKVTTNPEQEQQQLQLEKERIRLFEEVYQKLKPLTGTNGKESYLRPAQADLIKLVKFTKTKDNFSRLIDILRQWRAYPGKAPKLAIQNEIVDIAVANGLATNLIPILAHIPIYGVAIMDRYRARFLMKALVTPVDSATIDPSSPNHTQNESLMVERLNNALQLTSLLAVTSVPATIESPTISPDSTVETKMVSLSPTNDLVSGMILLTAMLRVAATAAPNVESSADSASFFSAALELIKSLKMAEQEGTIHRGTLLKEQLWTLAAATESLAWVRGDRWNVSTKGQETNKVDEIAKWLENILSQLQNGSSFSSKRWTSKQRRLSKRFPDILSS